MKHTKTGWYYCSTAGVVFAMTHLFLEWSLKVSRKFSNKLLETFFFYPLLILSVPKGDPTRELERDFFQWPVVTGHMGKASNWKKGRFRLEIRKKFLSMKVEKQWHRLTRKDVVLPFLEELKSKLDMTLSNVI